MEDVGLVARMCPDADRRSRRRARFSTDNCRERGYVCTSKADVSPSQMNRRTEEVLLQIPTHQVLQHFLPARTGLGIEVACVDLIRDLHE